MSRKITDLDIGEIQKQKDLIRAGYDLDIIPSDIVTVNSKPKNTLEFVSCDARSRKPLYVQIAMQIEQHIMSGSLKGGEPLPSIRNLANTLGVSIVTIKQAYFRLRYSGYIEPVRNRGYFVVGQDCNAVEQYYKNAIKDHAEKIAELVQNSGMDITDIIRSIEMLCSVRRV